MRFRPLGWLKVQLSTLLGRPVFRKVPLLPLNTSLPSEGFAPEGDAGGFTSVEGFGPGSGAGGFTSGEGFFSGGDTGGFSSAEGFGPASVIAES